MLEVAYLAFIPDLFHEGNHSFFLLENNRIASIEFADLQNLKIPVVCVELKDLFDQLRNLGVSPPETIIDLEQARKLAVGVPIKDGGKKYWNAWSVLKKQGSYREDVTRFRSLFIGQTPVHAENNLAGIVNSFLHALRSAWTETVGILKTENEYERFCKIEIPVQNILNRRQDIGIKIDLLELEKQYNVVRDEKYKAYIRVATALKISPSGFTFRTIRSHLKGSVLESISDDPDVSRFEHKLKLASENSSLAQDIFSLLRSDRDLRTLSRLSNETGRSYPSFTSVGTITSRVLVRDPYIQGLRKKYRSVIVPDNGYEMVYLDYDQFEPGILASLSGDENLIQLYESGDIYTELAVEVFKDKTKRSQAKQVFISFLYGMSEDRIAQTINPGNTDVDLTVETLSNSIEQFFTKFSKAMNYRELIRNELFENGRIETLFGGHRKRSSSGSLSNVEKRWALSQRIQGTGSLIFKEAALQISHALGKTSFVLPMHDAFLLQFKKGGVEKGKEISLDCMKNAMKNRCSNINPKVSVESFSG